MSSITVYAEHQHVLCELVQWDEIFGKGGGAVTFASDVTIHAPDASIGQKDRPVILRVVVAGPGNVSRGTRNPCAIKDGDLVLANLFHRTDEVRIMGQNFSLFDWDKIMAKLEIDPILKTLNLVPLQCYLVCQPDEDAAAKLMMGKSKILSPHGDAQMVGELEADHRGRPQQQRKVVIERVVSTGPGAVVDGLWQEPPNLAGDMVMFDTSVSPVRFVVRGEQYTLVQWRTVMLSFRSDKAQTNAPETTAS